MVRRLIRSSSMGQSSDLLRPFRRVPIVSNEQKTERNQNPEKKVAAPAKIEKQEPPTVVAENPRKCIFSFPSPPRVEKQRTTDYFLNACASCKKKLDFKEDIFMYGDLQAFCSPECRDDQIASDGKFSPLSPVRNQPSKFSRMRNIGRDWITKFNFLGFN